MHMVMYVLDASSIIAGINVPPDKGITTPEVLEEVKLHNFNMLLYRVESPDSSFIEEVRAAAKKTGDLEVLSDTDINLLALALQEHGILVTDDYAMQNVATKLGIKYEGIQMRGIKEVRRWKWRCESCGRYFRKYYEECPVCGGKLRRVKSR